MKKKENENVSKLKIIPLGGLEQIGMNITAFEYEDSIIASFRFPQTSEGLWHLRIPVYNPL